MNLYEFCNSNPVNFVDPDGEFSWLITALGAAAGFVAGVASETVSAIAGNGFNWSNVGASTGIGAIVGAWAGVAFGDPTAAAVAQTLGGAWLSGTLHGARENRKCGE